LRNEVARIPRSGNPREPYGADIRSRLYMSLMKLARSEHVQSLTVEWSLIPRLIDRASPFLSEHSLGSLHITVPDGQDVIDSLPGDSIVFHGDCRSNRVHLRLDAVATLSCLNEDLIGVKHEMRIGEDPVLSITTPLPATSTGFCLVRGRTGLGSRIWLKILTTESTVPAARACTHSVGVKTAKNWRAKS
jgi:hypothetical protein